VRESCQYIAHVSANLTERSARALHQTGVIEQQFSLAMPIIVHELEYYDVIAAQTRCANPPRVAKEFDDWITRTH
jgi:hypothetical protein